MAHLLQLVAAAPPPLRFGQLLEDQPLFQEVRRRRQRWDTCSVDGVP